MSAALNANVDKISITSCWRPMLGSIAHAIVWGIDQRKLPMGVPPFNKIYVIDLRRGKPVGHFTRTRGPYEARFSEDQTMAIVDDEVVDLAKGKVVGYIYDMKLDDETCPPFPGKQSG